MSVIVSDSLKTEVTQSIKRFLLMAEKHYGKIYGMPSVSYDLNSTVGGTANYYLWHIRVNPRMLVENKDDYLINAIGHEVAHLITRNNDGIYIKSHGKEWKDTMAVFGLEPKRCHSYQTWNLWKPQKRFVCFCECNALHYLSVTQRRRIERGIEVYCPSPSCNHFLKEDGFHETEQEAGEWRESEKKRLQKEAVRVSNATKNATKKRTKRWLESQANLWMGG